jgi:plasmid stabilization system protein ParE
MREAMRLLRDYPDAGPVIAPEVRTLLLDPFPYRLIYRVEAESVVIVAVTHTSQDPGTWRRRL